MFSLKWCWYIISSRFKVNIHGFSPTDFFVSINQERSCPIELILHIEITTLKFLLLLVLTPGNSQVNPKMLTFPFFFYHLEIWIIQLNRTNRPDFLPFSYPPFNDLPTHFLLYHFSPLFYTRFSPYSAQIKVEEILIKIPFQLYNPGESRSHS